MATETTQTGDAEQLRIGATLRAIRIARGARIGQLAERAGISHAYLSNIEHGRKPLPSHLVPRIADLLGVPPIALVRPDYFGDEANS